jgi:hypothetical protein
VLDAVPATNGALLGDMDANFQEPNPTREQWLRLHAAVRPPDDSHPVQGWELGEYVALMMILWDENHTKATQYSYMYIMCRLRSSQPSVFHHIEEGCSNCLKDIHSLMVLLGPPAGTYVRMGRTCINCQKDSPFAALFCGWCGRRINDLHLPFSMARETRPT